MFHSTTRKRELLEHAAGAILVQRLQLWDAAIGRLIVENMFAALSILGGTLLLAFAIDRGIPNVLDSAAYHIERIAASSTSALRWTARRMRDRHARIAQQNRSRAVDHLVAARLQGQLS